MIELLKTDIYLFVYILLFTIVTIGLLCFYLLIFGKFSFNKRKTNRTYCEEPVSIVIVVRDEAHHLIRTLPQFLAQQYGTFEVVIVNDKSNDETEMVVMDFMNQYKNINFVNLTNSVTTIKGDKFPISIGIRSASYNIVVLTDITCVPSSPYWLQHIVRNFTDNTEIVLGYSTFVKKPGIVNKLIRYDNFQTTMQYFSRTIANHPYMGNGRNLAYTKQLFMSQKGFAVHNHIPYGDDALFVNQAATKKNCKIEFSDRAFMIFNPTVYLKNWYSEKKQLAISSKYYKFRDKLFLNSYFFNNFLFYALFALAMFFSYHNVLLLYVLSVFLIKNVVQYIVFGYAANKLREKNVIPFIFIFDFIILIINCIIGLKFIFYRKNRRF